MMTVLAPAESLVRVHGRGLLLSILEKETILTRIKVLSDRHFTVETKDWDSCLRRHMPRNSMLNSWRYERVGVYF
jgi:hypothetical protein